jgi:hypothetical protein
MSKYICISDRLGVLEKWKDTCKCLTTDKSSITLDDNLHINNDVSDFVEKIRIENGDMTLLRALKGTFGFPFVTTLGDVKWFTKMMIYDLELDGLEPPSLYDSLKLEELVEFHGKVKEINKISVNTEHKVNSVLTKLVTNNVTPHVCILYGATELMESKNKELIQILVKKYKKKDKDVLIDMAKVLMTEWADLGDLTDYIKNNHRKWSLETWKALLFQMIAMLALIQEKYPTFRHNDLSMSNILVGSTRKEQLETTELAGYYKYNIGGKQYCVPDIGFRVLLADFDYASIIEADITHEKLNNKDTKSFGMVSDPNASFDVHMMLNWLSVWTLKLYKYDDLGGVLGEVKNFIYNVIDENYRGVQNRYLKHSRLRNGKRIIDKLIPKFILETNSMFEKYRNYEEFIIGREFIEEYNLIGVACAPFDKPPYGRLSADA